MKKFIDYFPHQIQLVWWNGDWVGHVTMWERKRENVQVTLLFGTPGRMREEERGTRRRSENNINP